MSIQEGAKYLEKSMGGRGILLGGVPGVKPANVLILGGGIVGTQAARMAAGLGANVTIMDVSLNRLRQLSEILPANVTTLYSNSYNVLEQAKQADLIVGAVLIPGAKAPVLISRAMLSLMKPGAVVIDVAVDQGGCIETCKPTTHDNPTYMVDGILHYCVANMPGAVPFTSTTALTNATMPYVLQVANKGWKQACDDNLELAKGLNMAVGKIFYKAVAEAWGL
jgi:alanine dehydrogenase